MPKHPVRRLNSAEIVRASQVISRHFHKVGDQWEWEAGWDDDRVVREIRIPGVHSKHISTLRRSAFGKTKREAFPRMVLEERLSAIEDRLQVLEDLIRS